MLPTTNPNFPWTAPTEPTGADGAPETVSESVDVSLTVEDLQKRLRDAESALEDALARARTAEQKIDRIVEVAHREANERDWCSEFDDILDDLGLPPRPRRWEVLVTVRQTLYIEATSEEDAEQGARWIMEDAVQRLEPSVCDGEGNLVDFEGAYIEDVTSNGVG